MTRKESDKSLRGFSHIEEIDVLDNETLVVLKSLERPGDPVSFLNDLIDTFIRETPDAIRALVDALSLQNVSASKYAAHQLKGLSGNIGAIRLSSLAEWIEAETEQSRFPDPISIKSLLEDCCHDAIQKLLHDWKL